MFLTGERADDSTTDLDKRDNRLAETKINLFSFSFSQLFASRTHDQTTNGLVQNLYNTLYTLKLTVTFSA